MEPCPYRQGESGVPSGFGHYMHSRNGALPLSAGRAQRGSRSSATPGWPQWSPALIGRESPRRRSRTGWRRTRRNGALPLSAGRAVPPTGPVGVWFMWPQWSPALIGRESPVDELGGAGRLRRAAMEPCPYRQGEADTPLCRLRVRRRPQWSPALIGRERILQCLCAYVHQLTPQWSPALIGRERRARKVKANKLGYAAMEPCPYRQGEVRTVATRPAVQQAAMEPCPYRQGEWARTRPPSRCWMSRNGALPLSAGRDHPRRRRLPTTGGAAMEPCPYRQGER